MMFVFIHLPAGAVRKARDIQQRVRQRIELRVIELGGLMLPGQPHLPQDLHPQIVTEPGEKRLVQQQAGKLAIAKFRR